MRVLFLTRSTLFNVYGGDTVQILSTAKYLQKLGVDVDIKLSDEKIDYKAYDLLHIFNVVRPADALKHIEKSGLPYVLSTIFIDFTEYQKLNKGIRSVFSKYLSPDQMEYLKAVGRWVKNGETIQSGKYLYYGHRKAVQQVAEGAAFLLPNSENEYYRFKKHYGINRPYRVIYNGVDREVFDNSLRNNISKDPFKVLCVARIEGNKNQLNLIKALNNTPYQLKIIGKPAPNHIAYYNACRQLAASNITFADFMPQEQLAQEYLSAKVHVLPSWNETCGLSSLEAAYHNCNVVITNKGDTTEYYGNDAWYCDPAEPASIHNAIIRASKAENNTALRNKIISTYNWQKAAEGTLSVYEEMLGQAGNIITEGAEKRKKEVDKFFKNVGL